MIKEKVFLIISESLGIPVERLSHTDKIGDLAADSIQLFELLIAFEREFEHQVQYEAISNIETIEDIFSYMHQQGLVSREALSTVQNI